MKTKRTLFLLSISLLSMSASSVSSAEKNIISMMSIEQRLERVERLLSPQALLEQQQQMQALRAEITQLREQLDQQGYEMNTLQQRQRSLYLDVDRRLSGLEKGPLTSSTDISVPPPPTTDAGQEPDVSSDPSGTDNEEEKSAYDKAFSMLKDGQYQQAITLFSDFLKSYPEGKYSDNAQYWLAEASYANREYTQSLSQFQKLISHYSDSSKIPGARLKIGYVYYELKNWSAARESLQLVIKSYTGTSMAKKAQERIDRIKREGH